MCQLLLIYVMQCCRLQFVACESGMFTYNAIQHMFTFSFGLILHTCVLQLLKYHWSFLIKGAVRPENENSSHYRLS